MATLKSRVLKSKSGLASTSQEELEKLSARVGRSVAPLQPQEASVIGANKDQAKMAGTPAQVQSSLRTSMDPSETLAGTQRRGLPANQTPTPEAPRSITEMQKLQGLGDQLSEVVARRFEQDAAAPTISFVDDLEVPQAVKDSLVAGNATPADYIIIANELGIDDVSEASALEQQIKDLLDISTGTQASLAAKVAAGDVKLSELSEDELTAMGMTDFNQLAAELEMTPEEVAELSIEGLQDVIDSQQAKYFDRAREAKNILRDPNSSEAERDAARKQLERLQEAGVDDVEIQVSNLEEEIADGQTITFGGEQISLEQLLDEDYMEAQIAAALASPEEMQRLEEVEREFAEFIKRNQEALEDSVEAIDSQTQEFLDIQNHNADLAKPSEDMSASFSSDVMNKWYPDYDKLSAERFEPNGVIQIMQDPTIDAPTKQVLEMAVNTFNGMSGGEQMIEDLGSMTSEEILSLGLRNEQAVTNYATKMADIQRLESLDAKLDKDTILTEYLGEINEKQAQNTFKEILALNSSGFQKISGRELDIMDANRDGKLDSLSAIKSRLSGGGMSLRELVNAGKTLDSVKSPKVDMNNLSSAASYSHPIYDKISKYFEDGKVTTETEARALASQLKDSNDLYSVYKMKMPGMNGTAKYAIKKELDKRAKDFTNDLVSRIAKEKKAPPIPYNTKGKKIKINSVTDLQRLRSEIVSRNKKLTSQGISNQADGGWQRNREWSANMQKLDVLAEYAEWMASRLKPNKGNPMEKARVLADKKRLENFKTW